MTTAVVGSATGLAARAARLTAFWTGRQGGSLRHLICYNFHSYMRSHHVGKGQISPRFWPDFPQENQENSKACGIKKAPHLCRVRGFALFRAQGVREAYSEAVLLSPVSTWAASSSAASASAMARRSASSIRSLALRASW